MSGIRPLRKSKMVEIEGAASDRIRKLKVAADPRIQPIVTRRDSKIRALKDDRILGQLRFGSGSMIPRGPLDLRTADGASEDSLGSGAEASDSSFSDGAIEPSATAGSSTGSLESYWRSRIPYRMPPPWDPYWEPRT